MSTLAASAPEVFTAPELAAAAGCDVRQIAALIDRGLVATIDGRFVALAEAMRVIRAVRAGRPLAPVASTPPLFTRAGRSSRETRVPLATSTALHGSLVGVLLLAPLFGRAELPTTLASQQIDSVRLVFLAKPGPGGGGGGGGLRQPKPPAAAKREGQLTLSSPVPPPEPAAAPPPEEPPPPRPEEPAPRAPVVSSPSDAETRTGVIQESATKDSAGPGATGGAGTGTGGGLGEGDGAGIGDGSGGGTGGGPYRGGSGIDPPGLLREVKPDYSEEARRRGIEGDVVFEIVVRRDGSVGDVRLLQGLGYGLDQRAMQAVRQWRFDPARRKGVPVDVLVEVSVEFKLR
jgi:TonB family protein